MATTNSVVSKGAVTGTALSASDTMTFGLTPTVGAQAVGKTYWDATNKTLAVDLLAGGGVNDVTMQIGQEEFIYVHNNTGAPIANGQAVRLTGQNGGFPTIALAKADATATAYVAGVTTQDIADGARGYVNVRGMIHDINTMGAVTGSITAFLDAGSGKVRATCSAAHKLTTGNSVVITASSYNGTYTVTVVNTLQFEFTATWGATSTGSFASDTWSENDLLYLSQTTAGGLTNIKPTTGNVARVARVIVKSATVGVIYVRVFAFTTLSDLGDTSISSPAVDQVLRYDGSNWVNGANSAVSAGAGVDFWPDDTAILAAGTYNTYPVKTLSKIPVVTTEDIDTVPVNNTTVMYGTYLYNLPLGSTSIEAGLWTFDLWAGVSSATNVTSLRANINRVRVEAGTVTTTGTVGTTTRTVTASTGTPFATGKAVGSAVIDNCSFVQTAQGLYPITAVTNDTVCTITVPINTPLETSAYSVHYKLFQVTTGEMNNVVTMPAGTGLQLYTVSTTQAAFTIVAATDKLALSFFAVSDGNRSVYFSHNGSTRYTHVNSPLVTRHNDLAGLNAGDYQHLTVAEKASLVPGVTAYTETFTNAKGAAGLFAFTHNLGQKVVNVVVSNNSDKVIIPDDITFTSTTVTTVDLTSYGTLTGDWNVSIIKAGGVGSVGVIAPNMLRNADFEVAQRGTTFAAASGYTLDGYAYIQSSECVCTVTQDTVVPTLSQSGHSSKHSLKAQVTTIDASIGAAQYSFVYQMIEGYDIYPAVGRPVTLSFWVKAKKTGVYCVSFRNSVADRSMVKEYTISVADTWEKKTVTFTMDYSGGTWDYTTGIGLNVSWALAVGSNYQTTKDAWQSGNYFGTSSQVNALDSTNNYINISQAKLEIGSTETVFVAVPHTQEVAKSLRYYERQYTGPGQVMAVGQVNSARVYYAYVAYAPKRIIPSHVYFNGVFYGNDSNAAVAATINTLYLNASNGCLKLDGAGDLTAGKTAIFYGDAGAFMEIIAEL